MYSCAKTIHIKNMNRSGTMGDNGEKFDSLGIVIMWTGKIQDMAMHSVEMGLQALDNGKEAEIFLISDGVWIMLKNSGHVSERLENFISKGGRVYASDEHARGGGLPKDSALDGIEWVEDTYGFLVDKIMESWDRVITC